MAGYENLFWQSHDGLKLHARDYPAQNDVARARMPLLCLPGLTRNARDFHDFALAQAGERRVIAVSLRGRGDSGYAKDAMSYVPATYVQDVKALLDGEGITRVVGVGTSLGGIVTMLMAAEEPGRIAGAVLNDVGPDLEAAGLQRIRTYLGKGSSCPTWLHAARTVREVNRDVYPDWDLEQWLGMAKRVYRLTGAGRIVLDYDLRIAEPFRTAGAAVDLWPALGALQEVPVLVLRGERSDVLGATTAQRMAEMLRAGELVTVPGIGHAPTLQEAEAKAAVARLLARVDELVVATR